MLRNASHAILSRLAVLSATAYLVALSFRPFPGDVALKCLMCFALAHLAWKRREALLCLAFSFSMIGDAWLGIDTRRFFVHGLASFLIAHLFFVVTFWRRHRTQPQSITIGRIAIFGAVLAGVLAYCRILWPQLGPLQWPVAAYITCLTVMVCSALRLTPTTIPLGAVLFLLSDSMIALNKFLWSAPWLPHAIWLSYAMGQLLIAKGMLSDDASSGDKAVI
jgi:uncharacterized membrane protein YhhN